MSFVSHAQNREDALLWRALGDCSPGFFIDVGAGDPHRDSVTKAFSLKGWRGINVEPSASAYRSLVEHRLDDVNLQLAIGEEAGRCPYYSVGGGNDLSTTVERYARAAEQLAWSVDELEVPCDTLQSICRRHAHGDIHFLKVDVNGAEQAVLAGADFDTFRPWVVIVAAVEPMVLADPLGVPITPRHPSPAIVDGWGHLLTEANYTYTLFDGLNKVYVANERLQQLGPALSAPVNALDNVRTPEEVRLRALAAVTDEEIERLYQDLYEGSRAISSLAASVSRTEQELQTYVRVKESLEELVAAMEATVSWRVTKPLRGAQRLVRKLIGKR